MIRNFRRTSVAMAVLLALGMVACGGPATPAAQVTALCRGAFGNRALNSAPGTVQDVRTLSVSVGPPQHPQAFAKARSKQMIGWCWTGGPGNYVLYAVATGYKPLRIEGLGGTSFTNTPAPGPAPIP